jgi:uncharacterized protein (DUF2236 family)
VAEGVDQHSDFRADPWRRLRGTLRSYLAIVYGTAPRARAEIRRLNALHRGIGGPVRDPGARAAFGPAYAARDPELSLWVHATLVDSTIVANNRWIAPLLRDRRARFYAETRPIGRAFGIPDDLLPTDLDGFDRYVADMLAPSGPVHPTPIARDIAAAILAPPLGPIIPALAWLPPSVYAWTLWPAIGLLPRGVRDEYGLRWGVRERLASAWLVAAWRAWRPMLPGSLRLMPQAVAADRRVGLDLCPRAPETTILR